MLNEETKKFIEELRQVLETHYVNKEKIQRGFDDWFDLLGLQRKKLEFYENKEGWSIARDSVRDDVLDVIRDVAWNDVWNVIRDDDWKVVWNVIRDTAWRAARDVTRYANRDTTWCAAWNAACLNRCDKNDNCKICEFRRKFCEPAYNLLKNGVFTYWVLKDKVIVITRPIIRHIGRRLHSETAPAIEWENEKYCFLWGVGFKKYLWGKIVNREMSFKETMKLYSIEQRMVALKMMGVEKLLKEAKAKLIHRSPKGNELYIVENIFRGPAYFLKYVCPSTGRIYISGIPPHVAIMSENADACMAWKLGINPEDYQNIREA